MSEKSLKKQVFSGLAWRGSTDIIQQVLQIVFTIILARLLTKGDFGLVATAVVINRFFVAITNVGFGGAIIRSTDVTENQVSAIFYIQLLLNLSMSVLIYFLSVPISNFFNEPDLIKLVEVMAWAIFLNSFQFPIVLMRKNMQFKNFSIIEISSMVISNAVAIVLAFSGFGFWSLVVRLFVRKFCFSLGVWIFVKWRPSNPNFKGLRPILSYGFNMLGSNLLSYFSENLISIIISKFLGKEIMGMFNIAYNLAIVPAAKIKSVLLSVLTPGFAKIQLNAKSFAENNRKALLYLSLSFMPLMFLISGMSENIILFMYGEKWIDASEMLLVLAIVGMLKGLTHLARSTVLVKGKARIILYATIIELLTSLPIMYFCVNEFGVYGLLVGYGVGALVSNTFIINHYNKLFEESFFYKTIGQPLLIGILMFFLVYLLGLSSMNLYIELTLQIILASIVYLIFIRMYYWDLVQVKLTKFTNKK